MSEKVLTELIKTRKELKKKYRSIKLGEADANNLLENTFKPITLPLKQFIDVSENKSKNLKRSKNDIKNEIKNELKREMEAEPSPMSYEMPSGIAASTPKRSKVEDESEKYYSQNETDDETDAENVEGDETLKTMNLSDLGRKNILDTLYGPHKNRETGEWMFGDSPIELTEEKIIIGAQRWNRTPGLFELLFYHSPRNYDQTDLNIYKSILKKTSAHKRKFNPNEQIKGTRSYKYQDIIGKLFDKKSSKNTSKNTSKNISKSSHKGAGMMQLNLQKQNYIYWDDPNELVERLKLLIASQAAGHTNHNNEIVSIIEELREANIIL